jgi:hypothetical protein
MMLNLGRGLAFELIVELNFRYGFENNIECKEPCSARR